MGCGSKVCLVCYTPGLGSKTTQDWNVSSRRAGTLGCLVQAVSPAPRTVLGIENGLNTCLLKLSNKRSQRMRVVSSEIIGWSVLLLDN